MAGSWEHMTDEEDRLHNWRRFQNQLDTGGDTYEAAMQSFGMVWWLAQALAILQYGTADPTRDMMLQVIEDAKDNYQRGLSLGGVEP